MIGEPAFSSRSPQSSGARGSAATRVALALAAGVVVVAVLVVAWNVSRPLRYGQVDPPRIDLADVEPAVAKRIGELTAALDAEPYSADAWGALGGAFDVHDLTAEAIACYERAAELDPNDFRWPHFAGYCRQGGDQKAALIDFQTSAELRPDYVPVHVLLGRGFLLTDDVDAAEEHYRRALDLDPTVIRAHVGLGEVSLVRGAPDEALRHLDQAVALGAKSGETYGLLAEAHRALGDESAADGYALAARDLTFTEPILNPERYELRRTAAVSLDWRRRFARQHIAAGRVDEAIAVWRDAARDDPSAAEPYGQIGLIEVGRRRNEAAAASFRRALELDPLDHDTRNNLGGVLVTQGKVEEGLQLLADSCRFLTDSADAHFNHAVALRSVGRYAEAIKALQRTTLIDTGNVRAHFELAQLLVREDRTEEAIAPFRRVTELEPERLSGHVNLARALHENHRYADAIAALKMGRESLPDETQIVTVLAWRLATCPDSRVLDGREALALVTPFVDAGTSDPLLFDTLAAAYAASGDFGQAARYVDRAIDLLTSIRAAGGTVGDEIIDAVTARRVLYRAPAALRGVGA